LDVHIRARRYSFNVEQLFLHCWIDRKRKRKKCMWFLLW